MLFPLIAVALAADPETFPLPPKPPLAPMPWVVERYEGAGWAGSEPGDGPWVTYPGMFDRKNPWNHLYSRATMQRAAATVTQDLTQTPWLEIEVPRTTVPWRLTGKLGDGPEILLADAQLAGSLRLNLAAALNATGAQRVTLRLYAQAPSRQLDFGARFLASAQPSQADVALGDLATYHGRVLTNARGMTSNTRGWPRLWWSRDTRAAWQQRAGPNGSNVNIAKMMADRTPFVVDAATNPERFPDRGLAIRPPPAPASTEPRMPAYMPAHTRDILWHGFHQWELAAMVSDDPEIIAQARRWAVDIASSRFWRLPEYYAFDDDAGNPLQALAEGYDLARDTMTPEERAQVRAAIHAVATELYWNILADNGYLVNELRANHAYQTLRGLGEAGLVLLGEDPDAALWVSLTELEMKEVFQIHTSGASWESPAYGRYGVDDLFSFATMLANVTGREHRRDAFFHKHADYQVAVADWEGRDLGYNQGGPHQWWNQWVLLGIAAFTRDPEHQWIGAPPGFGDGNGYGERVFFEDRTLVPKAPDARDTGTYFADIGVATWRTGWRPTDTILLFHDGPRPPTHPDRGAGHLTVYGRGHRFLADGLGALSDGHNLVSWDNVAQNQYSGGQMSRFYQDPRAGAATGDYQGWRRVVLYLRPDVIVVIDRLDVFHQNPERVAMTTWHLDADKVSLDGSTFTAIEGDTALQGTMVLDTDVAPDGQLGDGPLESRTVAWRYGSSGESRLTGVTLLSLSGATEAGDVKVTRAGSTWTFRTTTAEVKVGLGKGDILPGVSADGDVWAARVDAAGPRSAVVCGGTHAFTGGTAPASDADCAAVTLP